MLGLSKFSQFLLAPYIFEDILSKSKEFRWIIPSGDLEKCFLYQNIIHWKNIDVSLFHHKEQALESMEIIKYPVETLCLYVFNVDDNVIQHVNALGSELLSLELSYSKGLVHWFFISSRIKFVVQLKINLTSLKVHNKVFQQKISETSKTNIEKKFECVWKKRT